MSDDHDDVTPLIQEIRSLTVSSNIKTGAVALLNLIPYAGGAVASVIGEIASRRKSEKVCDILSDLNSKLESHSIDPETVLSKDQIIEVVHETLQTAATASDERKIAALKNGLSYAFISEDAFERKQLLLQVLRNCTSIELAVLASIYDSSDPYIIHEGRPPVNPATQNYGLPSASFSFSFVPQGDWRPVRNEEDCGQPSLLKFIADKVQFDEGATEGAIRLLDGKGLTSAVPNLHRSDGKVLKWTPALSGISGPAMQTANVYEPIPEVVASPLEASLIQFGRDFLRFLP